jgi:hypothetical protein
MRYFIAVDNGNVDCFVKHYDVGHINRIKQRNDHSDDNYTAADHTRALVHHYPLPAACQGTSSGRR